MDWGEQISLASRLHLPFCEQSVFPCSRQWNLGTTAGVPVSLCFICEGAWIWAIQALAICRCNCSIKGCKRQSEHWGAACPCSLGATSVSTLWSKLCYKDSMSSPSCALGWCLLIWEAGVPTVGNLGCLSKSSIIARIHSPIKPDGSESSSDEFGNLIGETYCFKERKNGHWITVSKCDSLVCLGQAKHLTHTHIMTCNVGVHLQLL